MGSLSERIISVRDKADHALVLPWEIDSVVTLRGSFRTHPDFSEGDDLLQDLASGLLDKGTASRSKLELAQILEDRGASIVFAPSGPRIRFSVRCLVGDLDLVVKLLVEQLESPAFYEDEFGLLKGRVLANIQRQKQETSLMAGAALSRILYQPSHPRYLRSLEEVEDALSEITVAEVQNYYEAKCRRTDLMVCMVGDVKGYNPGDLLAQLVLKGPDAPEAEDKYELAASESGSSHIEIADRSNIDVRMGHVVDLRSNDPDFLALKLGVFVLGGNFSSRLMSSIRDRDGLTYGIRSTLSGITSLHGGAWTTSVTLSQENVEKGIDATRKEISDFVKSGITRGELEEKKRTLTGSYQVQLSTTGGIASRLLSNLERGYEYDQIDGYPEIINLLKLNKVNEMVTNLLHPDRLFVASAGSMQ